MAQATALSVVEAQALGDRLKRFISLIGAGGGLLGALPGGLGGFLDNFDIAKVKPFIDALKLIGTAADLKGKVLAALAAAKAFTQITTTTADDSIVNAAAGLIGDGALLDFLVSVIEKLQKAQTAGTMAVLSDDHLAQGAPVSAQAFDIGLLVTIARAIWTVIQLFRKPATV